VGAGWPTEEEWAAYGGGASPVEVDETELESLALKDALASKRRVYMAGMKMLEKWWKKGRF